MKPTYQEIARELGRRAEARGWPNTARFVRALTEPGGPPKVALVSLLDAESAPLREWAPARAVRATVAEVPAAGPDDRADDLWLADKVLVAFPCGGLPTADALEALSTPLARPAGTTAVVLTGAQQITSADDLELVESTTRRWLLPGRTDSPARDLAGEGAYLWSSGPNSVEAFAERVTRDTDSLARWLADPISDDATNQLDHDRLLFALNRADAERHRTPAEAPDRREIYQAQDELAALRRRVLDRLRSDADSLEAAVRVAIDGLQTDLEAGLRPYLQRHLTLGTSIVRVVHLYCRESILQWQDQPREANDEWERALGELSWLIREANWGPVNRAAGQTDAYPARLLRHLAPAPLPGLELMTLGVERPGLGAEETRGSSAGLVKMICAAIVGPVLARLAGFGPVGMLISGGAAVAAALTYQWQTSQLATQVDAEQYGREMISEVMARGRDQLPETVGRITGDLRSKLAAEFDAAQALLDGALRSGEAPGTPGARDEDPLADLRSRLMGVRP